MEERCEVMERDIVGACAFVRVGFPRGDSGACVGREESYQTSGEGSTDNGGSVPSSTLAIVAQTWVLMCREHKVPALATIWRPEATGSRDKQTGANKGPSERIPCLCASEFPAPKEERCSCASTTEKNGHEVAEERQEEGWASHAWRLPNA